MSTTEILSPTGAPDTTSLVSGVTPPRPSAPTQPALTSVVIVRPERRGLGGTVAKVGAWVVVALVALIVLALLAITVGPRFLPYQALVVRSGSMSPTIPTGSVVFYDKIASDKVKVGDVIVFNEPGNASEKVTHRVYKIGTDSSGRYFTTKGDANGAPDDWRVPAVGTGWIARFHIKGIGYLLYDLQSTLARLLLLLVPAVLLGLITLYELYRDRGRPRGAAA